MTVYIMMMLHRKDLAEMCRVCFFCDLFQTLENLHVFELLIRYSHDQF